MYIAKSESVISATPFYHHDIVFSSFFVSSVASFAVVFVRRIFSVCVCVCVLLHSSEAKSKQRAGVCALWKTYSRLEHTHTNTQPPIEHEEDE